MQRRDAAVRRVVELLEKARPESGIGRSLVDCVEDLLEALMWVARPSSGQSFPPRRPGAARAGDLDSRMRRRMPDKDLTGVRPDMPPAEASPRASRRGPVSSGERLQSHGRSERQRTRATGAMDRSPLVSRRGQPKRRETNARATCLAVARSPCGELGRHLHRFVRKIRPGRCRRCALGASSMLMMIGERKVVYPDGTCQGNCARRR